MQRIKKRNINGKKEKKEKKKYKLHKKKQGRILKDNGGHKDGEGR